MVCLKRVYSTILCWISDYCHIKSCLKTQGWESSEKLKTKGWKEILALETNKEERREIKKEEWRWGRRGREARWEES